MYFSGIDATVSVSRDATWLGGIVSYSYGTMREVELDAVSVEFALSNSSRPLYSPAEEEVGAFMHSNVMVQGSLVLNHTDSIDNVLKSGDSIKIKYTTEYPELVNNVYYPSSHSKFYDIEFVEVLSFNQSLSPIVDNLTDIYQFIAKRLVSY